MKSPLKIGLVGLVVVYSQVINAVELKTDKQKFSYSIGMNIANLLESQGIDDLDSAAFAAGVDDVLNEKTLQMDIESIKNALEKHQEEAKMKADQAGQKKIQEGKAFFAKNKTVKGVVELESGLQYLVLKSGDGKQPSATDTVEVHYHGTLLDGTVFDSSVERGETTTFALNRVITGFRDSITQMKTGDKWRVFVPSELGYGERGAGAKIGPNETLIFEIELFSIQ